MTLSYVNPRLDDCMLCSLEPCSQLLFSLMWSPLAMIPHHWAGGSGFLGNVDRLVVVYPNSDHKYGGHGEAIAVWEEFST